MRSGVVVAWGFALGALGCSSSTVDPDAPGPGMEMLSDVLELEIGPDGRTFMELAKPSALEVSGNGETSIAWDLAFQGRDIFSNGGVSGPGSSSAFGPLPAPYFLSDTAPNAPIMQKDRSGSAFLDWYDYYGEDHKLYSRYHVYGVRDGERLFKVQVLGYYADKLGAPLSGFYSLRYAEVFADGSSDEIREITDIDARAGGTMSSESEPSACVDLDSQDVIMLAPSEALESDAWHLCFRREVVSVNGGVSGPRGLESVDLQSANTPDETEDDILERTAASELARLESVDYDALSQDGVGWQADGVATPFAERWLEPGSDPLALSDSAWFVIAADGASGYLLKLETLSGDPAVEQVTLGLRVKPVLEE